MADILIAYVGKRIEDSSQTHPPIRELTDWQGRKIGTVTLCHSWPIRNSFLGSRMFQAYARVGGRTLTGRTFGEAMAVKLRPTAKQKEIDSRREEEEGEG
jgi:hypothetical protein